MSSLYVRREDYSDLDSWRLVDWCRSRGADEFSLSIVGPPYVSGTPWSEADELLAPFRRRVASGGDRWRLTGESLIVLRSLLGGLFTGRPASAIEDPVLYRGGSALLAVVAREGEGTLTLREDDAESFRRTALPFHERSRASA